MPLPTTRIHFSRAEMALIHSALNVIVARLATAKLGSFPFAAPQMWWAQSTEPHTGREYCPEVADAIVALRSILWDKPAGKVRLDALQCSVVQFGLRHANRATEQREAIQLLNHKLENYRKRAKRSAHRTGFQAEYGAFVTPWRKFAQWMRYYLFYRPRARNTVLRANWRQQVAGVKKAFSEVPEERGYAPLSDAEAERMKKLAVAEIHRGRATVLLSDILDRTAQGEEYILEFVRKRVGLTAVREDAKPFWQRQVERAEMFSKSLVATVESPHADHLGRIRPLVAEKAQVLPENQRRPLPQVDPEFSVFSKCSAPSNPPATVRCSDADLVNGLVDVLFAEIENFATWQALYDDVKFHCDFNPKSFAREITAQSVSDLIGNSRPQLNTGTEYDLLNGLTEWVMITLLAAGRDVRQVKCLAELIKNDGEKRDEKERLNQTLAAAKARAATVRS